MVIKENTVGEIQGEYITSPFFLEDEGSYGGCREPRVKDDPEIIQPRNYYDGNLEPWLMFATSY